MRKVDVVPEITQEMEEYVSAIGFNNIVVLIAYLKWIEADGNDFENWRPNSLEMINQFGGTNCIGATLHFMEKFAGDELLEEGFQLLPLASISNDLPEGISAEDVPHQHMAMMLLKLEDGTKLLVDPGLGLVMPISVVEGQTTEDDQQKIAERFYDVAYDDDLLTLTISKPNGKKIVTDMMVVGEDFDPEEEIQKPLLRSTTRFKIDSFDKDGNKLSTIKIFSLFETVAIIVNGQQSEYIPFDQIEKLAEHEDFDQLLEELDLSAEDLFEILNQVIDNQDKLVDLWLEPIQRKYYSMHPEKDSPFEEE